MRWITRPTNKPVAVGLAAALVLLLAGGCRHVPNQFREDGPAVSTNWETPTSADVKTRVAPAEPRSRGWPTVTVSPARGAVQHEPVYFEDPFADKGDGRTDQTDPGNVHRLGWEDYLAMPYCLGRHILNWMFLPLSAVVTPPWTVMESDGVLSRQLLGYDHDTTPLRPLPSAENQPASTPPAQPETTQS